MTKNVVLGAISGYTWSQVASWAISLITSGYDGVAVAVLYGDNPEVKASLERLNFQVVEVPHRPDVYNQRFLDFAGLLDSAVGQFDRAIITDTRDVLFQSDPFVWLGEHQTKPVVVTTEGIAFEHEPWNKGVLEKTLPPYAVARLLPLTVCNVGILAGDTAVLADLCLQIGLMAEGTRASPADQTCYNYLLQTEAWAAQVQYAYSDAAFVCQVGTLADPLKIRDFRPYLTEQEPRLTQAGAETQDGRLYAMVHQYDRSPHWRERLLRRLDENLARRFEEKVAAQPVAPDAEVAP